MRTRLISPGSVIICDLSTVQDEAANAGSKVVASLFLSPGGPKFISLMLNLANHVMLQELKTVTTGRSNSVAANPGISLSPFSLMYHSLNLKYYFFR